MPFLMLTVLVVLSAFVSPLARKEIDQVAPKGTRVRILTFNAEGGGDLRNIPFAKTLEVIKTSRADIVGLQEVHNLGADGKPEGEDLAPKLATALGWHIYRPDLPHEGHAVWSNAVISKFPLAKASGKKLGIRIEVNPAVALNFFNIHLSDTPYQPYQLNRIPYAGDKAPFAEKAEEAIAWAKKGRGAEVALAMEDIADFVPQSSAQAEIVVGDFNEPSFQDWTERAKAAGLHSCAVEFPSVRTFTQAGFVDAYRARFPDEVTHPGLTWSQYPQPNDPKIYDRIDFVLVRTTRGKIASAGIVGGNGDKCDYVVDPYPSDHRAVVVELVFP